MKTYIIETWNARDIMQIQHVTELNNTKPNLTILGRKMEAPSVLRSHWNPQGLAPHRVRKACIKNLMADEGFRGFGRVKMGN